MIVPPEASQADGFAAAPVGSGPYKFVSWDRGNEIVLEEITLVHEEAP